MTTPRACARLSFYFALVLTVVLAVPRMASAHARVVRSNPVKNAEVSGAPARIDLWFNELLDDGFNAIEVFPAAERNAKSRSSLRKGDAIVDANDRTHLIVDVQPLPPGEYVVEWRVLSRDGHSAPGRLNFRVRDSK